LLLLLVRIGLDIDIDIGVEMTARFGKVRLTPIDRFPSPDA
jgi:hypothetical protein